MQTAISFDIDSNQTVSKYIRGVEIGNKKTARDYRKKLRLFGKFVFKTHNLTLDQLIMTLTQISHGPKIDVYDLLAEFVAYFVKERNVIPLTVKLYVSTVRTFLETFDVEISPRKFRFKVKMPKVIRTEKEALHKNDVQEILNACHSIKLKTYVLFLAATGSRASEALSIRLCDINFEKSPATVFIRGEYTKTKVDRTIMLTKELTQYLKQWIDYKHRTRLITHYDKDTNKTYVEKRTPKVNKELLLFSTRYVKGSSLDGLYNNFMKEFENVLKRLGGKYAELEHSKKRMKFTLHSFRRFVKTTISDLGHSEYSEYFIGHKGSSYYNSSMTEKIRLFKVVEPYLTFLDQSSLERKGADQQTRIETLEQENYNLKSEVSEIHEALAEWKEIKKRFG